MKGAARKLPRRAGVVSTRQLVLLTTLCAAGAAYVAILQAPAAISDLGMFRVVLLHMVFGLAGFLCCDIAGRIYARKNVFDKLFATAVGAFGALLIAGAIIGFVIMWFSPSR